MLLFGVNEPENETNFSLKDVIVKHVFEEKLGVKVKSVECIHRLGRKQNGKDRQVILRCLDFNNKINLLRNAGKLRGTVISLSEDYSKRVHLIRQRLWGTVKGNRQPDDKVMLRFDKLIINNEVFVWYEAKNERRKISGPRAKIPR